MRFHLRAAAPADAAVMAAIAEEGGSPDADAGYLAYVGGHGRLVVAEGAASEAASPAVVGFAGAIAVGDTVMVTDLFVTASARSAGVGGRLLAAVLDGHDRRMTCSSTHPGALAAYERAGLEPRWRLLTMQGVATGGGPALVPGPWGHDRRDLVAWFASRGAIVTEEAVVALAPSGVSVLRLVSDDPGAVMAAILRAVPAGAVVEVSVLEVHPFAEWLHEHGFAVVDHDVFCATDGVHLAPQLAAVHRGLL